MKKLLLFVGAVLLLVQLLQGVTAEDLGSAVAPNTTEMLTGE